MPVWTTTPVSETPQLTLTDWMIFETPDGERYLAGYNVTEGAGRVSSEVAEFDKVAMRGRTATGRVYQLTGAPGRRATVRTCSSAGFGCTGWRTRTSPRRCWLKAESSALLDAL
jgi:hypothetical protein